MESSTNFIENNTNFKCEICKNTFPTNQKKNIHIKYAHGEAKFVTCNVCNKIFERKYQLALHLKNYHQKPQKDLNVLLVKNPSLDQII